MCLYYYCGKINRYSDKMNSTANDPWTGSVFNITPESVQVFATVHSVTSLSNKHHRLCLSAGQWSALGRGVVNIQIFCEISKQFKLPFL